MVPGSPASLMAIRFGWRVRSYGLSVSTPLNFHSHTAMLSGSWLCRHATGWLSFFQLKTGAPCEADKTAMDERLPVCVVLMAGLVTSWCARGWHVDGMAHGVAGAEL